MQPDAPFPVHGGPWRNRTFSQMYFEGLWRPAFISLVVLLLYSPVLVRMAIQFYEYPSYSHGFLIPIFSGYLIWLKRGQLGKLEKEPSLTGLWIVFGAVALLYLGSMGAELFLTRISLVLVIFGLVLYFEGKPTVRAMAFPLGFLLLMIPLPAIIYNRMVFPLQLLSSRLATAALETLKLFPVLREGNLLILPRCTLEVVEACSGIRSLESLIALAVAYAYLAEPSIPIRALLTVAMVPIAIVGNGVRVVLAALLANYKGPETAEGFLHPLSSLIIFVVATVLLLLLHRVITFTRKLVVSTRTS